MADAGDRHPRSRPRTAAPATGGRDLIAAASVALFRDNAVLLVERGPGHGEGRWSLPGGHVEDGETAEDAARREVREETGITAGALAFLGVHEVRVEAAGGRAAAHYRISVYSGRARGGDPVAGSDARAACFIDMGSVAPLPLTDGALSLIRRAHDQVRDQAKTIAHTRDMIADED